MNDEIKKDILKLIQSELINRKEKSAFSTEEEEKIKQIINESFIFNMSYKVYRGAVQTYLFNRLRKDGRPGPEFCKLVNDIIIKMGYKLGKAHKTMSVYRGLKFK
jgi:hypothetical protein